MEFRVLGSLEVVGADGPLEIKGAKERAVLAYLLVRRGRSASMDEIVDAVWGESPSASAARSLQARISRLRRELDPGRVAASASVIARDRGGYRLVTRPDDVDAERFARLVTEARGLPPQQSLAQADRALGLLRGEPYAEFAYLDFAQSEIRRLGELELQSHEQRSSALVELGRQNEALPDLERLVVENPLREPLVRLLMLALYRSGRHADALAAYRRLVEQLRELGLGPEEESRRLERLMLQRAPELTAEPARTNIPERLTSFVGREDDRSLVLDCVAARRLVTLTGPGGVGKTSLALEAARTVASKYSDGIWLVELAPIREPARVAESVAEAMGIRTSEFEGQPSSALVFLESHLRRRELVLVVDNCEHLAGAVAELAVSLLAACPGIRLLATSREPLGVPGESVLEVAPLALPDREASMEDIAGSVAVRLFVERARAVRPDLELDESTLRAIADVCVHLDGLPLALELAAARVRTLSPEEIAERLADRFALLGHGPEGVTERQRTLAGVVEWSYQLLGPREQTLFRRVSVFPSSFGIGAAEEVCAGDEVEASHVADLIASLVDRSMVVTNATGSDRFRLLETLREFARAEADARGERLDVARRHAAWAMRIAESGHARVWTEGLEAGTRAFVPRRADFEAAADLAFELGDADLALALSSALGTLGFLFAGGRDDRRRVEAALALPGGALERRLRCMRALAVLLIREGHPGEAVEVAATGLRVAEQAGDEAEIARMRTVGFQARLAAGDPDVTIDDLAPAEEYAVRHGERWYEGMLHHYRGVAAFASGDIPEARSRAEQALDAFAASGDLWGIVNASETLGHALAAVGDYDEAMRVYERALAAGVRDLHEEAVPLLYHYGLSRLRAGDLETAETLFDECDRLAERESSILCWHRSMGAAHLAAWRDDPDEAARLYDEALALVREAVADGLDNRAVRVAMVVTLRELGHLAEQSGDEDGARRLQEEGLAWAQRVGEPRLLARTLEGLAGALSLGDRAPEAARILGLAEATRAAVHARLPEAERDDMTRVSERLRKRLGDERFEAELARGRTDFGFPREPATTPAG